MAINHSVEQLREMGAQRVTDHFRVALEAEGQDEFVYWGKRYLATRNDDNYKEYVKVMRCSKLAYLENDPELGNEETVIGEISRDSLLLHQFARSMQSAGRYNSIEAVHAIGRAHNNMIVNCSVLPLAEDSRIGRILVAKLDRKILIPPPMRFVDATERAAAEILVSAEEEFEPYAQFGGAILLKAYRAGLKEE